MKSIIQLSKSNDNSKPRDSGARIPIYRRRRSATLLQFFPLLVATVLITVIGWQALDNSDSNGWSAIVVASLLSVAAIIAHQHIVVRDSRLITSHLIQQI